MKPLTRGHRLFPNQISIDLSFFQKNAKTSISRTDTQHRDNRFQ